MEGWCREADGDRDLLMRIVALLVALAGLADRAAGVSTLRRRHVLNILCDSQAQAYALIAGLTPTPNQYDEPEPVRDAARLAATFRVLALVLYTMLQWRPALSADIMPLTGQCTTADRQILRPAVPANDTS